MTAEWDDGIDSPEGDDDAAETLPCPACGAEIYEEAEKCPVCGEYVIGPTHVLVGKPAWYVLLALAGVIAVVVVLSGLRVLL